MTRNRQTASLRPRMPVSRQNRVHSTPIALEASHRSRSDWRKKRWSGSRHSRTNYFGAKRTRKWRWLKKRLFWMILWTPRSRKTWISPRLRQMRPKANLRSKRGSERRHVKLENEGLRYLELRKSRKKLTRKRLQRSWSKKRKRSRKKKARLPNKRSPNRTTKALKRNLKKYLSTHNQLPKRNQKKRLSKKQHQKYRPAILQTNST